MDRRFRLRQIDAETKRLLDLASDDYDALAIDDESIFRSRFGLDCSRYWREKVIEFKRKRDLTDRAIRALYRNRTLSFGNGAIEIRGLWFMPALGVLQISAMALPIAHFCLLVFYVHPPRTIATFAAVMAFGAIYGATVWALHRYYVAPALTWRRHMRDRANGFVSPLAD